MVLCNYDSPFISTSTFFCLIISVLFCTKHLYFFSYIEGPLLTCSTKVMALYVHRLPLTYARAVIQQERQ